MHFGENTFYFIHRTQNTQKIKTLNTKHSKALKSHFSKKGPERPLIVIIILSGQSQRPCTDRMMQTICAHSALFFEK